MSQLARDSRGLNQRPTPLLPAGKAIKMRGSVPERSTKCAATSPWRTKLLMFRPSRTWNSSGGSVGCTAAADAFAKSHKAAQTEADVTTAFSNTLPLNGELGVAAAGGSNYT